MQFVYGEQESERRLFTLVDEPLWQEALGRTLAAKGSKARGQVTDSFKDKGFHALRKQLEAAGVPTAPLLPTLGL